MTQSWLRTVIDYHRLIVLDKAEVRSLFIQQLVGTPIGSEDCRV